MAAAVDLEQAADMLKEVELLVAGGGPEVVAQNFLPLLHLVAVLVDNRDAGLLAEGRIGEHHVVIHRWLGGEAVLAGGDVLFIAEAVQEQVHGAETSGRRYELDRIERLGLQVTYLVTIQPVVLEDVAGGREEKTSGAGGWIDDGGSGLGAHDLDDGVDQDARREILAGPGLGVLGVLFEEAFVDVALDVGAQRAPGFLIDEIDDEAAQVGGVLDLVLGFAENDAEDARFLAEVFEGVAVMLLERQAVHFHEAGPVVVIGDGGLLVVRRAGSLVVHFEEEEIGELLDVVAVGDPVVTEEIAVVPDFVDEVGGGGGHQAWLPMAALEIQLNPISRPGGDAAAEEISILGPDGDVEHEGNGGNWPIVDVARGHSLTGQLLEIAIVGLVHGLDEPIELAEQRDAGFRVAPAAA